jgi:hypothetical protein
MINDLPVLIGLEADLRDYLTAYHDELRNALLYVSVHSRYLFFGATWRTAANQLSAGPRPIPPETDKNTDIECARSRKACLNERREKYHCVNVMAPKKNETKSSR